MMTIVLKLFVFFCSITFIIGCGVKGDPLPPQKPNSIGKSKVKEEEQADPNTKKNTEEKAEQQKIKSKK